MSGPGLPGTSGFEGTFEGIWETPVLDYHKRLVSLASLLCEPCAHCGGKPQVGHSDYIGDHYTGDRFEITCSLCKIGTESGKWEIVHSKWNKRVSKMSVNFISGHLDLTPEEFELHYVPKIEEAIKQGHSFIVGDARGADLMAQKYLKERESFEEAFSTMVFHMFTVPRNNEGFFTRGGFTNDEERDAAMTAASHQDIAWVRPGRENSGTAKNLKRRKL